jgi:dihydropteroate synthase
LSAEVSGELVNRKSPVAVLLKAREFEFRFPRPAIVVGVVNVTPDSFSDGGRFFQPEMAVARALALVDQGAEIIEIGGESTRPQSRPVSEAEELRRVMPVVEELSGKLTVPISVDTMKVEVARTALAAGASIVNDVGANRDDPAMWKLVGETGAGYVCMHMKGTPQTMQADPTYEDVVAEVATELQASVGVAEAAGVSGDRIVLDPGLGFAKRAAHSYGVLARLPEIAAALGRPVLVGPSRKSFMREALNDRPPAERDWGTAAAVTAAVLAGAHIVRVHAVADMVQVVRVAEEIRRQG